MQDFVSELVSLFGRFYEDAALQKLLAKAPGHVLGRPADGTQFAVCKEGGFDLTFSDRETEKNHHQRRILYGMFLFNSGEEKHRRFTGILPFGFNFEDTHQALVKKKPSTRTWVIGKGRVPADHAKPDSDTWHTPLFNLTASYNGSSIANFYFGPSLALDKATEWKPKSTWQDLAVQPDQKQVALAQYKQETGASSAQALREINEFILKTGS